MTLPIITLSIATFSPTQHLDIRIDPTNGTLIGTTSIQACEYANVEYANLKINSSEDGVITWEGVFQDDVESGERVGQIHNFSVDAHISEEGVFLSDWAGWYPTPVDENGQPILRTITLEVTPIQGWSFVASGNPSEEGWKTPRPVDGMALVGNKHVVDKRLVTTPEGEVTVSVHLGANHADKAEYYLEAADDYLQLYVPLLGKYPYDHFAIVENFFSSGFAYPGFTVLGPRVVGMAPKSLAPGYLDHELLHNWWGNGVYVDATHGNWCEALTSYSTNYGRRALEDGADAARSYRRGLLNKVSLDPTLDNGALANFGSADPDDGPVDRFVGYDKGAFVFMMLEDVLNEGTLEEPSESKIWQVLARFAHDNMGKAATWKEIQLAAEQEYPDRPSGWLNQFFQYWVYEHNVPQTTHEMSSTHPQVLETILGDGWVDIDPNYHYYRTFPKGQISPTIAGTLAGARVEVDTTEEVLQDTGAWLADVEEGGNLLLIGNEPIENHSVLLAKCDDAIKFTKNGFIVDGEMYQGDDLAVLHTMNHPENDGEFITLFYSVGDTGWERLRFIWYYTKDTTVIWNKNETLVRRVFEPTGRLLTK
ncbi:MAG: hypothetical protein QF718_02860 [Phycisphaerales bacterium]|jgi:hypothetical protein|nr:hypothetical protein [Phycisphaerales bacterium]